MKTIITIENNPIGGSKVTVQVDDNLPVVAGISPLANTEQGLEPVFARPTANSGVQVRPLDPPKAYRTSADPSKQNVLEPIQKSVASQSLDKNKGSRNCDICGDDISHLHPLSKTCSKPECKKAKAAAYNSAYYSKQQVGTKTPTAAPSAAPRTKPCGQCGDDMPATSMYDKCANCRPAKTHEKEKTCKLCTKLGHMCKRHRNGEVKVTQPASKFLPGFEKTPEEIEALRPKATNLPGESVPSGGVRSAQHTSGDFVDRWNCQMCRDGKQLCTLHTGMEADGKQPPRGAGISTGDY